MSTLPDMLAGCALYETIIEANNLGNPILRVSYIMHLCADSNCADIGCVNNCVLVLLFLV